MEEIEAHLREPSINLVHHVPRIGTFPFLLHGLQVFGAIMYKEEANWGVLLGLNYCMNNYRISSGEIGAYLILNRV